MKHWIKDALGAMKTVRVIRKDGITAKLALVDEAELIDNRKWLAMRDYENQLMQKCINDMILGKSPCGYCEENKTCKRPQHGLRGCTDWWLRFLTEKEEKTCEQRATPECPETHVEPAKATDEGAEN